jgi:hypothetical protein
MRETMDAAVELQITGLEMAVATLNQADVSWDAMNAERIYARVREGIDSILYLLSKRAATAEQQMRIDALLAHLEARLEEPRDLTDAPGTRPALHGQRSILS